MSNEMHAPSVTQQVITAIDSCKNCQRLALLSQFPPICKSHLRMLEKLS